MTNNPMDPMEMSQIFPTDVVYKVRLMVIGRVINTLHFEYGYQSGIAHVVNLSLSRGYYRTGYVRIG